MAEVLFRRVIPSKDTPGRATPVRLVRRNESTVAPKYNFINEAEGYVQQGNEIWIPTEIEHYDRCSSKRCVIIIPVYKDVSNLRDFENASIRQLVSILDTKYEILLCGPNNLDYDVYKAKFNHNFSILKLNPEFFRRQKTYSNLCERPELYKCLEEYEYMLIYQTDAWIFEDKLEYFMDMGYDYIGGVHLLSSSRGGENGNGGFSLRKVSKMYEVTSTVNWKNVPAGQLEDCAFTQRFKNRFNLAPLNVCYEFSWQERPDIAITKNNGNLPMGCHAFHRFGRAFWEKYIKY